MAEAATKLPVKTEDKNIEEVTPAAPAWRPFETLRREVDRLFEDFDRGPWLTPLRHSVFDVDPLWGRGLKPAAAPAVDIAEKDDAYEISAELPGMDEKNIEVKLDSGGLTIKGEKREEKEEKRKGYHLQERRFGAFERYFAVPKGVDADKIEASFKKGVLTVTLPKKPEAQKPAKTIDVKVA